MLAVASDNVCPSRMKAAFLLLAVCCASTRAQNAGSGSIRGQVLDSSGGAVPGAEVTLANHAAGVRRGAKADDKGRYAFANLPLTGVYLLECRKDGFAAKQSSEVRVRAAEIATVDFRLDVFPERASVTVYGAQAGVRSDGPALGVTFGAAAVENTPVSNRRLTNMVLLSSAVKPARGTGDLFLNQTLFVVNGNGRRQTSFVVDGSTADDAWGRQTIFSNLPLAALEEMTVLTSGFSSEFGRTTGAVINLNTKSGSNDLHGEAIALWRPGDIQARSPLASVDTIDRLLQFSGALGGALVKNRAFYLLAGEGSRQDRDSAITSALAPGIYRGEYRGGLGMTRLDYQINDRHRAGLRLNADRFDDSNPNDAVGGLALPSSARIFSRATYGAQAFATSVFSPRLVSEARAQYQLGSPITRFAPVTPSIQYVRPGLATEGESRGCEPV
jgi:Carboxypeptidase regulatory-like domain